MRTKYYSLLILVGLFLLPSLCFAEDYYELLQVIDGDTIEVSIENEPVRVRFLGVNTPEVWGISKPAECFGPEAKTYVENVLADKPVIIEGDILADDEDKYHRLLRYIYYEKNNIYGTGKDKVFLNSDLVEKGYAMASYYFPYSKKEEFKSLEQKAKEKKIGVWSELNCPRTLENGFTEIGPRTIQHPTQKYVSYKTDTTFYNAYSPYKILSDIHVASGATLSIEPGVVMKFDKAQIMVYKGTVRARGTANKPITFTSIKDDEIAGDTNEDGNNSEPGWGDWDNVILRKGARNNLFFDYVVYKYAGNQNHPALQTGNNSLVNIQHSTFVKNGNSIDFRDSDVDINYSNIYENFAWDTLARKGVYQSGVFGNRVRADNNWWGKDTGPFNLSANPGGGGWPVDGRVDFKPWLTTPFDIKIAEVEPSLDPVIIIPGITGSWEVKGEWHIDPIFHTYDNLYEALRQAGYEPEKTLFTFPYQWRQKNEISASQLQAKIAKVKQICKCSQVDLIAHSMGGLVARYYVQTDSLYKHDVDQVIFLAVPHLGSPKAYLAWEGGEMGFDAIEKAKKTVFQFEALKQGYFDLQKYIQDRIKSTEQLLPIFDYLKEKGNGKVKTYPTGYPVNTFLENLNNKVDLLSRIKAKNYFADNEESNTYIYYSVIDGAGENKWKHGEVEKIGRSKNGGDVELGIGDGSVPLTSAKGLGGLDSELVVGGHNEMVTKAQQKIIKELTGQDTDNYVSRSAIDNYLFVRVYSPVDFLITSPSGETLGYNPTTGKIDSNIADAFYSGNDTDTEFAIIPNPESGKYDIQIIGTAEGDYQLASTLISGTNEQEVASSGTTTLGASEEFSLDLEEDLLAMAIKELAKEVKDSEEDSLEDLSDSISSDEQPVGDIQNNEGITDSVVEQDQEADNSEEGLESSADSSFSSQQTDSSQEISDNDGVSELPSPQQQVASANKQKDSGSTEIQNSESSDDLGLDSDLKPQEVLNLENTTTPKVLPVARNEVELNQDQAEIEVSRESSQGWVTVFLLIGLFLVYGSYLLFRRK